MSHRIDRCASPGVSVIIPTHNRSHWLRGAIHSVLHQTYEDFELIVVDDASTDHTETVAHAFTDDRIRYIRHDENRGGGAARNTGIGEARADRIAFLDDDDEWLPRKLELQAAKFDELPEHFGLVYCARVCVDARSGRVLSVKRPQKRGSVYQELLFGNPIGSTSLVMVRRACFEKVGGFDERLPSEQDYELYLRIAKHFEVDYVDDILVRRRIHDDQISGSLRTKEHTTNPILEQVFRDQLADHPDLLRRVIANMHYVKGVEYCKRGSMRTSRARLRNCLRLDPLRLGAVAWYLVTFLGCTGIESATHLKRRLEHVKWQFGRGRGGPSGHRSGVTD